MISAITDVSVKVKISKFKLFIRYIRNLKINIPLLNYIIILLYGDKRMLSKKEIESIKEGKLKKYFPLVKIYNDNNSFEGNGEIYQISNKAFAFKIKFNSFPVELLKSTFQMFTGKLEDFYFEAIDSKKSLWKCNRPVILNNINNMENYCDGYLQYLEIDDNFGSNYNLISYVKYYFLDDSFNFPISSFANKIIDTSFQCNYHKFSFRKNENSLTVNSIDKSKHSIENIHNLIIDSLSFMYSMPVNFNIRILKNNKGKLITIFPQVLNNQKNKYPPYNFCFYKTSGNEINIYKKYFLYVCKNGSTISEILRCYYETKANAIRFETFCLPPAICVEHLLQEFYSDDFSKSDLNKDIDQFLKNNYPVICSNERINIVIQNSLKNAKRIGTTDVFKSLIELNVISDEHVKVWKNIRHPLVHKGIANDKLKQKNTGYLIDLINLLVLYEIGYTGKYSKYAEEDNGYVGSKFEMLNPALSRSELKKNKYEIK